VPSVQRPVLIALYVFTFVIAIAAFADAKVVWLAGISGAPGLARHLWRMCSGMWCRRRSPIAAYSARPRLPPEFGYGRVSAVEGNKLTVDFDKAGAKR